MRKSIEVIMMANTKERPQQNDLEKDIKTYNPTKSTVGRIILLILIAGMILGIFVSAIIEMINVLG